MHKVDPSTLQINEQVDLIIERAYAEKNGIDISKLSNLSIEDRADFNAKVKSL